MYFIIITTIPLYNTHDLLSKYHGFKVALFSVLLPLRALCRRPGPPSSTGESPAQSPRGSSLTRLTASLCAPYIYSYRQSDLYTSICIQNLTYAYIINDIYNASWGWRSFKLKCIIYSWNCCRYFTFFAEKRGQTEYKPPIVLPISTLMLWPTGLKIFTTTRNVINDMNKYYIFRQTGMRKCQLRSSRSSS